MATAGGTTRATYRVNGAGGAFTTLVLDERERSRSLEASIVSLTYSGAFGVHAVSVPQNTFSLEYGVTRNGAINELEQHIRIGRGDDRDVLNAHYQRERDRTALAPVDLTLPGLALIAVVTEDGLIGSAY